jgi:formate dehydrogenase subunit gamma
METDTVRHIVELHRGERGPLLPVLRDIQERFGYIDQAWVPLVASELNLSRADVHGVVSFYSDFRTESPGKITVRICRAEACQSVGAEGLVDQVQQVFGTKIGRSTPDGSVQLEQVFCLGNCALAPAVQINGGTHGKVDRDRLVRLVVNNELAEGGDSA